MQLLKQVPKDILSETTFPLIVSITCYLIETMVSFFNSNGSPPGWHINDQFLDLHNPLLITFLENIRGFMMNSYHSYFDFMRMMVILHIMGALMRFSQKYLAQKSSVTFSKAQQDQEFIEKKNSPPMKKLSSLMISNSKKYIVKALQCLFYFTVSYYICQFVVGSLDSSRSIFVEAKHIPIQEHDILPNLRQNQFNRRLLEELQEEDDEVSNRIERNKFEDSLTSVAKLEGAGAVVVSKDGKIIFRLNFSYSRYTLAGMDISNPLAIKYYPPIYHMSKGQGAKSLALSSDANTLFVVDCEYMTIYDVSDSTDSPVYLGSTFVGRNNSRSSSSFFSSVTLYEEEKSIIIMIDDYARIFNIRDLKNPTEWYPKLDLNSGPFVLMPEQRKALVGGLKGLSVIDISDREDPVVIKTILKNEIVISISLSEDQSTAFVGVLNKTLAHNQKVNYYGLEKVWRASLSIFNIDMGNLEPRGFLQIDQLESCLVHNYTVRMGYTTDIKMTSDSEYAYWVCNKDYGYVEMASGKISRFSSPKSINAIALAHNDRILVKADYDETNLYALYKNIERDDSFIWTPRSLAQLKFNISSQILLTSKKDKKVAIITNFTLQVYDTSNNSFSLLSTIELEVKPRISVLSNDGKRLYMKTDEKTIQILDWKNSKKIASIDFPEAFEDYFLISPDDQMIFVPRKIKEKDTSFFAADISEIDFLQVDGRNRSYSPEIRVANVYEATTKGSLGPYDFSGKRANSLILSDRSYVIATNHIGQKEIQFFNPNYFGKISALPIPNLAGNLPPEISSDGKFLYVSTPEYLMEINLMNPRSPKFSRLMELSIKQFSLVEDNNVMYAVTGDCLEIIDLKPKYSLASIQEDFLLGTVYSVDLQLLSRNPKNKYNSMNAKHRYLTANFYETSISEFESEPIISYSILPSWINFDKNRGRVFVEPKFASLLGSQKIYTTGSIQVPSPTELISSLSFLNNTEDSNNLIADLTDKGYLDKNRFLTTKFNAYQKLSLKKKYSPFENEIRYFLRNYLTDQEFTFQVSSSLFILEGSQRIRIETPSLHYLTVQIAVYDDLKRYFNRKEKAQIVKRTFSASRSVLTEYQTQLTLEGSLLNIHEALEEVVIDFKEDFDEEDISDFRVYISVSDSLNPPAKISTSVLPYFRINQKPIANPVLPIQTQINKFSLVSGQSFSININPNTFYDINDVPLTISLDTKLDWLDLSGLILTGTPPKKLWPFQVDVTLNIANEFKSEKVTFSLNIGMSAVIVLQYVVLYFGYAFSAYKGYKNFHKFYNILAQKFYRYAKVYKVSVGQEVTDATITPIGFFGKEFQNADLLMNYLKKHLCKDTKDLMNNFKDDQRYGLNIEKLIAAINQTLESLTFVERHSVKYYIQIDDEQKDIIHRIILDMIILSEINLPSEKPTLRMFKKIKDHWIDIVALEEHYFKVNKLKLNYVLQNFDSKTKPSRSSQYTDDSKNLHKDELLDITDSSIRSRYMSDSHLFEKPANNIEESLLDSTINSKLENVNMELLELALQGHAFKSHHLNAQKEQVTIISNERKVGSSCFYKIKALFKKHLQKLHFTNKEELGYGLRYRFEKDILHFCGTPEPKMEYETLVMQFLNKREMIMREIYIFGAENKNRRKEHIEQVQGQL